jgi:hypothetical protein
MDPADDRLIGGLFVEVPDVVGMTAEDARDSAVARGVEDVRVLDSVSGVTITPMNMDLRPNRLTLVVEDGIVVTARFG